MKHPKRKRYDPPSDASFDSDAVHSDFEDMFEEKAVRGKDQDSGDSEEEVFGVGGFNDSTDEEKEDNEDKLPDSDIEGLADEDDDLPDVKAWGKKKRSFYSTDYVDQDYGGYDEKDAEAAEQEEEEAKAIQKRLVEQLDDADFSLDMFSKKPAQKEVEVEVQEVIKSDLRKMSMREKIALLEKESPEFFGLTEQFKVCMTEVEEKLHPILKFIKEGKIPASPADKYIRTKYHVLLNYCVNITYYLLLKAKRIPVQSHPVVRRLYQYCQLLKQLKPVDKVMAPQIETILEKLAVGDVIIPVDNEENSAKKKHKKKKLKLLSQLSVENMDISEVDKPNEENEIEEMISKEPKDEEDEDMNEDEVSNIDEENQEETDAKRAITYQIMKNKGLTPYRKKENRNPRVKHRNKFRKAKIRRKGQIREPRKELQKYGGEISGIKVGVVKSIKLK
ncbi:hypothetical protein C0J52_11435 [Blattella germanica]|nr:hypothetical protein C0J52_11435 [Blattella germanica]